jgi:predicted lysophospholipase L1 biosynthesis ABC-type transport system permease subunit
MMAWVIRIKQFMELNYLLIACTVFSMASMIFFLSVRLRSDEFETFHYLGCRRTFVSRLVIFEWGALMFAAACFAVVITLIADRWMQWMLSTF